MDYIRGALGLAALIFIAWLFSTNKKNIDWRLIITGIVLQIIFGLLITKVEFVTLFFDWISEKFVKFLSFSNEGAQFLFGDLATEKFGFIFAFNVLPTVIFFSTVSAGLYYLGILQKIVYGIAWIMARTMRLSGAESLSAAGNIFLGQTEAPLLVRPFIKKMTTSELMCLMTGGMATIAGGVLAGYVAFLGGDDPVERTRYAAYLLSASIMNAPAAIVLAKIIIPENNKEAINKELKVSQETLGENLVDALSRGASDGLKLALNIAAMLLAFIAIIFAVNWVLLDGIGAFSGIPGYFEFQSLNSVIRQSTDGVFEGFSLQYILGQLFRVFAFIIGVEWSETALVGSLLGQKIVLNEFVAYLSLAELKEAGLLSPKSIVISTYALCGFANFSSIAIQIGGIGGMAPERQGDLSRLGFKALFAASLATLMTATIAGALFG